MGGFWHMSHTRTELDMIPGDACLAWRGPQRPPPAPGIPSFPAQPGLEGVHRGAHQPHRCPRQAKEGHADQGGDVRQAGSQLLVGVVAGPLPAAVGDHYACQHARQQGLPAHLLCRPEDAHGHGRQQNGLHPAWLPAPSHEPSLH